jgi:poly(A) polymerase
MTSNQRPKLDSNHIHPEALKITQQLQKEGFTTYLVGGCVRDLLSGIQPKDFDIGTIAHPRQIKRAINDAYIIGKRFRLVLVKRGTELFEVATFRREATAEDLPAEGEDKTFGDNIFGSPQEDAMRRDFTLNGLFYDPIQDELIDYCNGLRDIKQHTVRMIGDPEKRLQEDPIRILRALRFSHRLDFKIESQLREAMMKYAHTLKTSVLPRRREEILKLLRLKDPTLALTEAHDLHILEHIFPSLDKIYHQPERLIEFNLFMRKIHSVVIDSDNPAELFGYLMLAYYRSVIEPDPYKRVYAHDILKNEQLKNFMSLELGMYNVEQSLFAKALEFQNRIRRSDGSDASFMNESIPLAIMLAKADYLLSCEKLHNWETALEKFTPRSKGFFPRNKRRRRRR